MKKLMITVTLVAFAAMAHAQFTFGARAGFNLTNMNESGGGISLDTKMKPGFQIGVVGDYAISEAFVIQPGILFATQGARIDIFGVKGSINLNYLQVPINAQYKLGIK